MGEINDSFIKKTSIKLTRNAPVALVVGAAGFLGSNLVDKLLSKGISVVGIDDLQNGKKENLKNATENKNFHLLIDSPEIDLDLIRLDYIFIFSENKWNLEKILKQFVQHKGRLLFISSIDLYDKQNLSEELKWFKHAEGKIAKFAADHNLNARILRLGPVFGPRMDFQVKDPIIRLIQQALVGDLQKEGSLDFSSRALFVSDATELMVKTIFSGSTAQKIFDGVLPTPIKVTEVKQVLLDPVWYESKDFTPTELPPWSTPNLLKTIKFLNWHPSKNIVAGLRETLSYFKDNEISIPKPEVIKEEKWDEEKKEQLESFKQEKPEKPKSSFKSPVSLSKIYLLLVIALVSYSLIWPGVSLGWSVLSFRNNLADVSENLEKGEFGKSLDAVIKADFAAKEIKSTLDSLEPIRKTGVLTKQFEMGDSFSNIASLSVESARSTVLGVSALFQSLKAVTGETEESPAAYFSTASVELAAADESLSRALLIKTDMNVLSDRLKNYSNLVKKARAISNLLPNIVALDGVKNYLILMQNNMELRPGGGFIGSFALVSFEGGKLKKIEANDIYAIDGQLSINVEPPKEIKDDLGQNRWFLRDSNWEPDFPTAARQAEWFYTKETGQRVEGVVAIDISAIQDLLSVIGELDLTDYNEKITADNLFERALAHSELSFFPGTQAKKSFLTALINQAFNKLFFLPNQNWPGIVTSLGKSLEEKHLSVYLDDQKLFSFLVAQNWAHVMPRASDLNTNIDFLAPVEANLGANKLNYYLDRSYNLETVVGKEGEIKHRLKIAYLNRSPSDAFPGGKYKNRMRIYLPFGAKLERALWGEADITNRVTNFVDYGRSGLSILLDLSPKEQKSLILDYSVPVKIEFKDGKADYRLDVVKEAGTGKDSFNWTITYPLSYKLVSDQAQVVGPQEQTIKTDLSKDRSFKVQFSR